MLTIQHAASAIGFSDKTIRRRISDGSLLSYRIGPRLIRVDRDSLLQLARPMASAA
jgi:excisionase family DNA binding protein